MLPFLIILIFLPLILDDNDEDLINTLKLNLFESYIELKPRKSEVSSSSDSTTQAVSSHSRSITTNSNDYACNQFTATKMYPYKRLEVQQLSHLPLPPPPLIPMKSLPLLPTPFYLPPPPPPPLHPDSSVFHDECITKPPASRLIDMSIGSGDNDSEGSIKILANDVIDKDIESDGNAGTDDKTCLNVHKSSKEHTNTLVKHRIRPSFPNATEQFGYTPCKLVDIKLCGSTQKNYIKEKASEMHTNVSFPEIPFKYKCNLCHGLCQKAMRLKCDKSPVCWRCAVKKITSTHVCWKCGELKISSGVHLIRDDSLRKEIFKLKF